MSDFTTTKDLGTYHVIVELLDGRGWIQEWNTAGRFLGGSDPTIQPLSATWQRPTYINEEELISCIIYMFTDGNYSCDCNKLLFLARASNQNEEEVDACCDDTLPIKQLTLVKPDGSRKVIYGNI